MAGSKQSMATSPPAVTGHVDSPAVQVECERLREQLRRLEEQHARDQKTIAELEPYRRSLYTVVHQLFHDDNLRFTQEEVDALVEGQDGLPLEAFLGKLEQLAKGQ